MARTKEFDEDAVLLKAMRLFWKQGYEKTSMKDLVANMGVHKGSLYDTFGDKRSLYLKTLDRYCEMMGGKRADARLKDGRSAKEAIGRLFEAAIEERDAVPDGCFIVNTAVELGQHDPEAKERVLASWDRAERVMHDLIVLGQRSGELSGTLNAEWLSWYLNNALIGLRVMVKTVADRQKLRQIIAMNMLLLEQGHSLATDGIPSA